MTPDQALKIVEAVRELARHGPSEEEFGIKPRDWARARLEEAGLDYWPDVPVELEIPAPPREFDACRFPNCECNMNVPTPHHCEEYRG